MGLHFFIIPLVITVLIVYLSLKNNKKIVFERLNRISKTFTKNDVLTFQKFFLKEIKTNLKIQNNESNLSYIRRLRQNRNSVNEKHSSIISSYFHFLIGYQFDELEELFTQNDLSILNGRNIENIPLTGGTKSRGTDYNIYYSLLDQNNEKNIYKIYNKEEKEEIKKLILESQEYFKDSKYSFYDKFIYIMLREKMNIDSLDKSGRTPLFIACYLGKENLVFKLVSKGANLYKKNKKFMNLCPLTSLVLKRRFSILKKLLVSQKIDLKFLINELNILERQYVIDEESFSDAMKILKPFLVRKQAINFFNQRKDKKYLKYFSDDEIKFFLKKYIFEDVFEE